MTVETLPVEGAKRALIRAGTELFRLKGWHCEPEMKRWAVEVFAEKINQNSLSAV